MPSKKPWIKVWRKMQGNDWLNEQPERLAAWVQILLATDDDTGEVELSKVPARRWFHRSAWWRFCHRLADLKMITDLRVVNLGDKSGRRLMARVTNHGYYQGSKDAQNGEVVDAHDESEARKRPRKRPRKRRASDRASASPSGTTEPAAAAQAVAQAPCVATAQATGIDIKEQRITENTDTEGTTNTRAPADLVPKTKASPNGVDYQEFADLWNQHCGLLPKVQLLSAKRRSRLKALVKELGYYQALEAFTRAAQQVAADEFWVERGYGFDNLLVAGRVQEKAEKWQARGDLSAGRARMAGQASRWLATLDAIPEEDQHEARERQGDHDSRRRTGRVRW